jgi:hypothetical protein
MNGQQPKHGPRILPPPEETPEEKAKPKPVDPNAGRDLWGVVPTLAVPEPWSIAPPSFNEDPPKVGGGGAEPPKDAPIVGEFHVDLASARTAMNSMLADSKLLVSLYQDLRDAVWNNKDNIFGQNAYVGQTNEQVNNGAAQASGGGGVTRGMTASPSPIQHAAREFAYQIIPAEELVLQQCADAIELVGMFIAGVDRAGQSYGHADRKARFPDPPPEPVTSA